MTFRSGCRILILLTLISPTSYAQNLDEKIEKYLVNFKGETGFTPLVNGLKFEYERLQHNKTNESEYEWAVAVAIEPNGRYAVGFGKNTPTGPHPAKNAKRFCKQQRKVRSMKAKCRTFAVNDKIHKPYKR